MSPESFASRKALPEAWRGIRDDELSKLSSIEGCIFVHASGFIGGTLRILLRLPHNLRAVSVHSGNTTKEGALKMAKIALDL